MRDLNERATRLSLRADPANKRQYPLINALKL